MNQAFAIVVLGGCGTNLPPLELESLDPAWGYNGEITEVAITGRNFYPSVTASSFAEPEVDSDFRAWIDTDPPTRVDLLPTSLTTFKAQVGEGIVPGLYGFTVESVGGDRDTLDAAFQVTPTKADHLFATVPDEGPYVVGEWVTIDIEVQDPDGYFVPIPLAIDVVTDVSTVEFMADTLDHQQALDGGIRGEIRDGHGYVTLTNHEDTDVHVTIAATDPTSVVSPTTLLLRFSPGNVASIAVFVTDDPEAIVAGADTHVRVAYLDENGVEVTEVPGTVTLYEACNAGSSISPDLVGPETFTLPLTRATGTAACPGKNTLVAYSNLEGIGRVDGVSQDLTVAPGAASQLGVSANFAVISAGEEEGNVTVYMQDQYDNVLPDYETASPDLVLHDDVGGLQPDGAGSQECERFEHGLAVCSVGLWTVGSDVTITAQDGKGLVGDSNPIQVIPGHAFDILVAPQDTTIQAGTPVEVQIQVTDVPGNALEIDPTGSDQPRFTDEDGADLTDVCDYDGPVPGLDEVHSFLCWFYVVDTKTIVVDMPSRSLSGFESPPISVENGDLSQVSIDLGGVTSVEAGVVLKADFVGTDAWGNPYVVQSDADLDVRDGTGSLTPLVVHLDAAGTALGQSLVIKRATLSDRVVAEQSGDWLGSSPVFAVTAGAFAELSVDVPGPVVSRDDPGVVLVSAVDSFGNALASYSDSVDVSSTQGLGSHVLISSWVDGRAAIVFPFDTTGWLDTLVATDGVHTGESDPFDVADFGCADGPTANLEVGAGLPLRLCILPGMALTTFDLSSSAVGGSPIEQYYFLRGDGTIQRMTTGAWSTTWNQPGGYEVAGIVIDRALCASQVKGWVYAGYDDGQPVGPLTATIDGGATAVHAFDDWVTVDVSAKTCTGDPAVGGTVLASVDIGDLVPSGTSRSTGTGIELTLDALGSASIEWSMFGQPAGGIGTFVAGVRSGAARGEVPIDIDGDSSHPTVFEVSPVGTYVDVLDSIAILFSDAMQDTSVSSTSVVLTDESGAAIPADDLSLATSGPNASRELIASFANFGGSAETYTLTLTSDLRKAPGLYDNANTLDGNYTGGGDDFTVSFGAVSDLAPDVQSCDPSTTLFRPDGDATGMDPFEADAVDFDVAATGPAAWWLLEVFDLRGTRVGIFHVDASDLDSGTVTWDGRNNDGIVLPNGIYVAAITAKDDAWNEGAPCLAMVTVDAVLGRVSE
jgi:hypothetical protein